MVGRTPLMGLFCLLGVFAIGLTSLSDDLDVLAISLFLVGMATFALYPIAINLGCNDLEESHIISATQVMLICYSVGSVVGPIVANIFMEDDEGLMSYLLTTMMATTIYMFSASVRSKKHLVAGK
jgi:MFS family permease